MGPLLFQTDALKLALKTEDKNWQRMYAKHLNEKCAREMDEILEFFDNMQKKLGYGAIWLIYQSTESVQCTVHYLSHSLLSKAIAFHQILLKCTRINW